MTDEIRDRLQIYYQQRQPPLQAPAIHAVEILSAGWESDVYGYRLEYDASGSRQTQELVLRLYSGADARTTSVREFNGMQQLFQAGYPVPQVFDLHPEEIPFGKPFIIMQRIHGSMLWPELNRAEPSQQEAYLQIIVRLFVQLHSLDWRPFVTDIPISVIEADPYCFVDRWLAEVQGYVTRFPDTGLGPILGWLKERRDQAPCHQPALIHWDFHPANILLAASDSADGDGDDLAYVIDWTQIEVSDPRFDLAWTLLLTGSQSRVEWRDAILAEYRRQAPFDIEELAYFEVAACLKRLGSVVISLTYGPEMLGMRADAVDAMRTQMPAFRRVYAQMQQHIDIPLPQLEQFLAAT